MWGPLDERNALILGNGSPGWDQSGGACGGVDVKSADIPSPPMNKEKKILSPLWHPLIGLNKGSDPLFLGRAICVLWPI